MMSVCRWVDRITSSWEWEFILLMQRADVHTRTIVLPIVRLSASASIIGHSLPLFFCRSLL